MTLVGKSVQKIDALSKVKGEALYPGDINLPNQAYMKVVFARRPHAIVRSIDTTKAEALEGVIAVLTARDVPVNEYGLGSKDQPVLCGPGSSKPFADHVRNIGDQVALVIAETEDIAAHGCELIAVDYEDLPVITDPRESMKDNSLLIHPDRASNVFCRYRIRKGDVDEAFAKADVIIESKYTTPIQEHVFLQPEAGIAYLDEEGRVTVQVAGQWSHEDREQVAHALHLPEEQVRIIYPAIGGAFGGREDMSVQIILGLAVFQLHGKGIDRPVKIIWTREESMIGHHKRHPFYISARWGATKQGKVIAAEVDLIADGGAYIYTSPKVLGNATLMCTGPYEIPNVKVDACAVYTNNIPTGAFRGFGGPQGAFAAECQMNKLAEKLGMDPVEIRMRNVLHEGSLLSVGTPLPKGVSIDKVVEQCALKAGWVNGPQGWNRPAGYLKKDPSGKKTHGIGFACSFKNIGFSFGAPEQSNASIELHGKTDIEYAVVYQAGADVGQGAHTIFAQVAAEALNLPVEKIRLVVSDTAYTQTSGSASASRMTFMAGNAIRGAAEAALERWKCEERPAVAAFTYRPPRTTSFDPETGKCEPNFAYGYVAEAIESEVDLETGKVRLSKVTCADDVGKAINPAMVIGQVEGAVVQAAGYTLMENFIEKDGKVLTPLLSNYLIPTVLDIPDEVDSVILEYADPIGPYGARGMGEMPYLPFAGAVTAAVKAATGIWFNDFPLTAERVYMGIRGQNK